MDKVTILMSTYNGEKYLKDQLNSILNQKGAFELSVLIRDDGSKEQTRRILQDFEKTYSNIKVIYGANIGWMKSFNELIFKAEPSQYYAFSDQDDVWLEHKIEKSLEKIKAFDKIPALYGSNVLETDENLNIINNISKQSFNHLDGLAVMLCSFTLGCTMLFNNKARELYISSPKKMFFVGHDWLMATLCAYFGHLIYDEKAFIYHRRHGTNESGTLNQKDALISKLRLLIKGKIGYTAYQELYDGYRERLPEKDLKIIEDFIHYKKSFFSKCRLILNPKVKKLTLKGTVLLKIAILFNRHI